MATRIILIAFISLSILLNSSLASEPDSFSIKSKTEKSAFKGLIRQTILTSSFLGGYFFIAGTAIGGSEIGAGGDPRKATAKWAATSLTGMFFSVYIANSTIKSYREMNKPVSSIGNQKWNVYHSIFAGVNLANINNYESKSTFKGSDGSSQWSANTPEVKTAMTFPVMGYRLGANGTRFGGEFEISIVSNHTNRQTVSYDAVGEIYVSDVGDYVPLQISQVEIPDRFLMLHSYTLGGNFYTWLPNIGVKPYIGIGVRLLLNSVQSQYKGPADLIQQKHELALDSKTLGWGFSAIFGFRLPISGTNHLFAEFRPTRHYFTYESGANKLRSKDHFTLQSFDFQMGWVHFINK